jgi:hypothetical protein
MASTRTTTLRIAQAAREWRAMREDHPPMITTHIDPQAHACEPCTNIYDQDDHAARTSGPYSITRSRITRGDPMPRSFRGGGFVSHPIEDAARRKDADDLLAFRLAIGLK